MFKVWISRFGGKEFKYFDSMEKAEEFCENLRIASDDNSCCGVCN